MKKAIVVGCGLSGAVVARYLAEDLNIHVDIYERRNHIGGNMYDYVDENNILVHMYGPHIFHTKEKELYEFMCKYGEWEEYKLECGAVINEKYTPTPFNFQTIDDFYSAKEAEGIKNAIKQNFEGRDAATVLELLNHSEPLISDYAKFLFDNDYSLYTAKQWGISPSEIDPSVLKRVPIRLDYETGYFDDEFQTMPKVSYTEFFRKLLDHPNISINLNKDVRNFVKIDTENNEILVENKKWDGIFVYTGAIDELYECKYGKLPYRSLYFKWETKELDGFQDAPVVAYPQAEGYTRITEYKKLPKQNVHGKTTIAIEYSIPYTEGNDIEPYYPIPNDDNYKLYEKYRKETEKISNLFLCGRLADYKYYNMDQALQSALELCKNISKILV